MDPFEFPPIYSYCPLYSKQPKATVYESQLKEWCGVILGFCEHYKITSMTLTGTPVYSQIEDLDLNSLPNIFDNKEIERVVNEEFRLEIFKHLIHVSKKAEYLNANLPESGILIYWRSLVDWANLLHDFVENSGQLGTILTVYELTKSEDSGLPIELRNLDYNLLVKVLKNVLIKQGKAQILMSEDDPSQIGGVKIV